MKFLALFPVVLTLIYNQFLAILVYNCLLRPLFTAIRFSPYFSKIFLTKVAISPLEHTD